MMTKNLIYMIGAHKTASTHFQRSMVQNSEVMAAHDVAVIAPPTIGVNLFPLTNLLRDRMDPELVIAAADKFIELYVGEAKTALMMNENICGNLRPNMLTAGDKLYKFAPKRVERMAQMFPQHSHTVALAIRNPVTFLVSAWQENMKGHAFNSFESYVEGVDVTALSWSNLIYRIRKTMDAPVNFLVWRYEEYHTARHQLVQHIAGAEAADSITWLDRTANPGLSAQGLAYLEALGEDISQTNRAAAAKLFPRCDDFPAFQPFSAQTTAQLNALYEVDWENIQQMSDCRVFGG